jgi:hypothetical protein
MAGFEAVLPSQLCATTPNTHIHNVWTSGDGGEAIVTNSAANKAADTIQMRREYAWHAGYLPHVAGQACWSAEAGDGRIEWHRRSFEVTNRRDSPRHTAYPEDAIRSGRG